MHKAPLNRSAYASGWIVAEFESSLFSFLN